MESFKDWSSTHLWDIIFNVFLAILFYWLGGRNEGIRKRKKRVRFENYCRRYHKDPADTSKERYQAGIVPGIETEMMLVVRYGTNYEFAYSGDIIMNEGSLTDGRINYRVHHEGKRGTKSIVFEGWGKGFRLVDEETSERNSFVAEAKSFPVNSPKTFELPIILFTLYNRIISNRTFIKNYEIHLARYSAFEDAIGKIIYWFRMNFAWLVFIFLIILVLWKFV